MALYKQLVAGSRVNSTSRSSAGFCTWMSDGTGTTLSVVDEDWSRVVERCPGTAHVPPDVAAPSFGSQYNFSIQHHWPGVGSSLLLLPACSGSSHSCYRHYPGDLDVPHSCARYLFSCHRHSSCWGMLGTVSELNTRPVLHAVDAEGNGVPTSHMGSVGYRAPTLSKGSAEVVGHMMDIAPSTKEERGDNIFSFWSNRVSC